MGIKASDQYHVAACHECHAELDQGRRFTKEQKRALWREGWARTLDFYLRQGWITITLGGS
jgi:hypothetical protein